MPREVTPCWHPCCTCVINIHLNTLLLCLTDPSGATGDNSRQKDQFKWSMKDISNGIYEYFMEPRECHHEFLYREMSQEYKTNSIKFWARHPCQTERGRRTGEMWHGEGKKTERQKEGDGTLSSTSYSGPLRLATDDTETPSGSQQPVGKKTLRKHSAINILISLLIALCGHKLSWF